MLDRPDFNAMDREELSETMQTYSRSQKREFIPHLLEAMVCMYKHAPNAEHLIKAIKIMREIETSFRMDPDGQTENPFAEFADTDTTDLVKDACDIARSENVDLPTAMEAMARFFEVLTRTQLEARTGTTPSDIAFAKEQVILMAIASLVGTTNFGEK